jgi:hypothetical protein
MAARVGEREEMPPEVDNFDLPPPPEKPDKSRGRSKRSGGDGFKFALFIMFLMLILAVVAILALNLFGWREAHVMPFLREAPVIRNFFANAEAREVTRTHDELSALNTAQADRIERVEYERDELRIELAEANALIHSLRELERDIVRYRTAIEEWNRMLAHADPVSFAYRFFDYVDPSIIPWLMGEVNDIQRFDDNTRRLVSILNAMEESTVGEMLVQYLHTNQDMMLRLVRGMGSVRLGEVLETIDDAEIRAIIISFMADERPDFGAPSRPVRIG